MYITRWYTVPTISSQLSLVSYVEVLYYILLGAWPKVGFDAWRWKLIRSRRKTFLRHQLFLRVMVPKLSRFRHSTAGSCHQPDDSSRFSEECGMLWLAEELSATWRLKQSCLWLRYPVLCKNSVTSLHGINLGATWRQVNILTYWSPLPLEKTWEFSLKMNLSGPQAWCGHFGEQRNNSWPCRLSNYNLFFVQHNFLYMGNITLCVLLVDVNKTLFAQNFLPN